jgi:hypothetical protein
MKRFAGLLILGIVAGCSGGDVPISPKAEGPPDPKIQRASRGVGGEPAGASTTPPVSAN